MSTSPTPNDLTRQQLDELDALLQRMLTLPLQDAPPPAPLITPAPVAPPLVATMPAPNPPNWRMDPPAPLRRPFVTEEVPAREPEPAIALAPALFVPVTAAATAAPPVVAFTPMTPVKLTSTMPAPSVEIEPEPPPMPVTLRGVDAPALPANFRMEPEPVVEPEPVILTTPEPPPVEEQLPPRVPLLLWPLFAVNWMIETILGLFGPLGGLMTNTVSKHLLGVVGVLLLAAAGAWSARGMGWVHFPIPR